MYQYSTNPYIYHYGIKGMKWGVRRYQNKDGSLTPAGRKRAQKADAHLGRTMITRKRQLAADKSDLKKLNSGKRKTSVGFTKKRQDAYDKRDKAALERRIKDNEQKSAKTNASDGSKSKSKTKKAITIGTSVAAGLIASNLGSVPILNITGNLPITRVASATLGVIGGMKVYDLMNRRPSDNK